ncbi:MAG: hypothetical protein P4L93_07515 [Coriobacteriia bacterium]|nr:hypothetical protein [Coriobacteriia bacterium]
MAALRRAELVTARAAPVREVFDAAEDALRAVFDAQTLADITRCRGALREWASMYHI